MVKNPKQAVDNKGMINTDNVQTEFNLRQIVISLSSKGVSNRDICDFLKESFSIDITPSKISEITSEALEVVREWQDRPLSRLYPIVYLDGLYFRVRNNARIMKKCAYVALGINEEGLKEILGIWIDDSEKASLWSKILTDIKNRGVEDILICCVDGLTGFPEAIRVAFPNVDVQQCIVHQVRNTMKYLPHKDREKFCADLRTVYNSPTEDSAALALTAVEEKWSQYKDFLKSWRNKWSDLSSFFAYPPTIRKMIYTTNTIENLNLQFRKVTRNTNSFISEESLMKRLWRAQDDISKKWTLPVPKWGEVIRDFANRFPSRMNID